MIGSVEWPPHGTWPAPTAPLLSERRRATSTLPGYDGPWADSQIHVKQPHRMCDVIHPRSGSTGQAEIGAKPRDGWAAETFEQSTDNSQLIPDVIRQVESASDAAARITTTWLPTAVAGLPPGTTLAVGDWFERGGFAPRPGSAHPPPASPAKDTPTKGQVISRARTRPRSNEVGAAVFPRAVRQGNPGHRIEGHTIWIHDPQPADPRTVRQGDRLFRGSILPGRCRPVGFTRTTEDAGVSDRGTGNFGSPDCRSASPRYCPSSAPPCRQRDRQFFVTP